MSWGALGVSGRSSALEALLTIGIPSRDPARAPIALAVATVALRNTPLALSVLERSGGDTAPAIDQERALVLLADGFEMLEEDLDKERFFALVRRTYWESPDGSPRRRLMQRLIGTLDF